MKMYLIHQQQKEQECLQLVKVNINEKNNIEVRKNINKPCRLLPSYIYYVKDASFDVVMCSLYKRILSKNTPI